MGQGGQGMDELLERRQGQPDPTPRPFDEPAFTCGPVSGTLEPAVVLDAVRAEAHPGFDRILFTFSCLDLAPGAWGDLPAVYAVAAWAPPFTSSSGEPLVVEGNAFLRVNFLEMDGQPCPNPVTGAASHAPSSALARCLPAELRPGLGVVTQLCPSDDFEGYLEWIVGLTQETRWRVRRLDAPVRLQVDVASGPSGDSV